MNTPPRQIDVKDFAKRILQGEKPALARAITLVESRRSDHRAASRDLIQSLLAKTGKAHRIGISGVPGVGKSTLIDSFGAFLVNQGLKVAVLAIDPSSTRTGGSILGDKTRMAKLSQMDDAYIRPSPSAGTLGGVAAKTRETMLLCEAFGFDVILVETVGTGQSEVTVSDMVDFFLVLMLAGAGDDLQGIKKGILELADMIAINKADGDNATRATASAADYKAALHILTPAHEAWLPPVKTISGLEAKGLEDLWAEMSRHREIMQDNGAFYKRRQEQNVSWMWAMVDAELRESILMDANKRSNAESISSAVRTGELAPSSASSKLLNLIRKD